MRQKYNNLSHKLIRKRKKWKLLNQKAHKGTENFGLIILQSYKGKDMRLSDYLKENIIGIITLLVLVLGKVVIL
jgi:hypothetical protein